MKEEKERQQIEKQKQQRVEEMEQQCGIQRIKFVTSLAKGTGGPVISYPKLNFNPSSLFAVGSPIGLFVTIRYLVLSTL